MAWQGRKQEQFTHLLCELWRDEEREILVGSFRFVSDFNFVCISHRLLVRKRA